MTFRPLHMYNPWNHFSHDDNKSYHHTPLASHIHTTLLSRELHVELQIKKSLIYTLIAILFLVYMKVNFAAILDFFFQIYTSVTSSPNPLCYHKYVILSSTCLAVYL